MAGESAAGAGSTGIGFCGGVGDFEFDAVGNGSARGATGTFSFA